ncbi:MAG: DUF523 and DUF1722 domain-containing protein [Planctomycetes bacterium]|nr:DUF523 and DUF1722 domain-containing protein [Planctomycetota bacterium]
MTVPRIGISSCLLGEKVRWDGSHKHDAWLTGPLGSHIEWVAVCPEVEIGMGTPREAIHLAGKPDNPRLVGVDSGEDWTGRMEAWSEKRVRQLEKMNLSGYVLKKNSPSCGMERVKIWRASGQPTKDGVGAFAAILLRHLPLLPVEEEGRLEDPVLREHFVERVFAHRRWLDLAAGRFAMGPVVEFHSRHKLQLLAHSPDHYRRLGPLVAKGRALGAEGFRTEYGRLFMEGLAQKATRGRHVNVLQHMAGHFKESLSDEERRGIEESIADYRGREVALEVPLRLIRQGARRLKLEYLLHQTYFEPAPAGLKLRNHV